MQAEHKVTKDADQKSDMTSPLVTESITDVNITEHDLPEDDEDNVRKRLPDYFFREV